MEYEWARWQFDCQWLRPSALTQRHNRTYLYFWWISAGRNTLFTSQAEGSWSDLKWATIWHSDSLIDLGLVLSAVADFAPAGTGIVQTKWFKSLKPPKMRLKRLPRALSTIWEVLFVNCAVFLTTQNEEAFLPRSILPCRLGCCQDLCWQHGTLSFTSFRKSNISK